MENADCGVSTHAEAACVACHTDAESLGTVHEGATTDDKMPKRLRKTEVSEDACLTCHYGTREGLAEATASLTVVDKNGTEAHPHDLPATEAGEHESIACGECHAMHTPGSSADTLLEAATERCQKCHHQNVFECGTCHE